MSEEILGIITLETGLPACIHVDGYTGGLPIHSEGVSVAEDGSSISFASTTSRLDYFRFSSEGSPDPGVDDCEVIAELTYQSMVSGQYGRFINHHQVGPGNFSLGVYGAAGFLVDTRYDPSNGIQVGTIPKNSRFTYRFRKTGDLSEFWVNSTKIRQHSTTNRDASPADWCLGGYLPADGGAPVISVGNGCMVWTLHQLSIRFL